MQTFDLIKKYFPELEEEKLNQLLRLQDLTGQLNAKLNLVSRQDFQHFEERHLLPSLAFSKIVDFQPKARILDVGTGGGLPGLPLAILFPEAQFTLIDSIGKKVKAISELASGLQLKNVEIKQMRAENLDQRFNFVIGRAVAALPTFMSWVYNQFSRTNNHALANGILYLKGGPLEPELAEKGIFPEKVYNLIDLYPDISFLEGKYIAYFKAKSVKKIQK